eukprot:1160534-Pelagomonas_calceolata.AAC.4
MAAHALLYASLPACCTPNSAFAGLNCKHTPCVTCCVSTLTALALQARARVVHAAHPHSKRSPPGLRRHALCTQPQPEEHTGEGARKDWYSVVVFDGWLLCRMSGTLVPCDGRKTMLLVGHQKRGKKTELLIGQQKYGMHCSNVQTPGYQQPWLCD